MKLLNETLFKSACLAPASNPTPEPLFQMSWLWPIYGFSGPSLKDSPGDTAVNTADQLAAFPQLDGRLSRVCRAPPCFGAAVLSSQERGPEHGTRPDTLTPLVEFRIQWEEMDAQSKIQNSNYAITQTNHRDA
ncbi:hypothetical protein MG293_018108 [Ovis ammon polii]|uniref:Uncharacterized protein n=1 Tax=Ovis ammon polii TaxID=230172 RepID=A0AAD4Y1E1_OVIAM|nr:hypothetical protein MG293_018108 [Ovis ammon polii]